MKYLLYYKDGFIKKFPLNKKNISIGRKSSNDIVLDFDFISREHVMVRNGNPVSVRDAGSTNGMYIGNRLKKESILNIGDSFNLGGIEFFLREGEIDEFKTASELHPIFDLINRDFAREGDSKTRYRSDIYAEILKHIASEILKGENFYDILAKISTYTSNINGFGSLSYLVLEQGEKNIIFSVENFKGSIELVDLVAGKTENLFAEKNIFKPVPGNTHRFYSFPVSEPEEGEGVFLYFPLKSDKREEKKIEEFLSALSKELSLFSNFREQTPEDMDGREISHFKKAEKIIVANRGMRNLINQSIKIASSDVFILIEGESGTGKELFARLIHNNSKRRKGNFIAINCAAIPETLLESELFGTEKGAYTGAHEKRKGKLELASGGTLVLDEIGDMPVNLQAKLLRVLQEHEFYRVGGTEPIQIDLRIISITNKNLKELIIENKFRSDLYYRLVHHKIALPPLRDRREDIPLLIEYFTSLFSKKIGKKIKGYAIKSFRTLTDYNWPGNIRQLENEIMRLVNLVDENENINYELLSDEIRSGNIPDSENDELKMFNIDTESQKRYIIRLLEENEWNKSQTAKILGMTYQGLHKKMKRLGIENLKI